MQHAEGRVANPEDFPENPLRERLEQVGRHPHKTCRLALRTNGGGGGGRGIGGGGLVTTQWMDTVGDILLDLSRFTQCLHA